MSDIRVNIGSSVLELVKGDITSEATDAIVNAANSGLRGGGGVDGAIHSVGGPEIMAECRKIGGCPTGGAVLTTGGKLKAKYVIHAVGPVYRGGTKGEEELLAGAYRTSLEIASKENISSIAFPSISTGAYGYPIREASRVALKTVIDYIDGHPEIELVRFVLFSDGDLNIYRENLEKMMK
jgi:O-acetyl-ADP-ribose deacetylase (regulator of RNase III)